MMVPSLFPQCVGITIIKWDSTCHSQTHGTEPPVHFCCSHYISPCFLSTSPFHSLSLSLLLSLSLSLSFFLSLSLPPLSLCGCKIHVIWCPLQYETFSSWWLLPFFTPNPAIAHINFTNHSPTIFYDYHTQRCLKNAFFALGPTVV